MDWIFGFIANTGYTFQIWVNYLLDLLQFMFDGLILLDNAISTDESTNAGIFGKLAKWLKFGWLAGLGGIIGKMLTWIRNLQDWLKKHLAGVIKFLTKLRAWFDRYYKLHILPIINLIQRIRKFLLILRLLHIHIADALDKKLSQYEALLNGIFLKARGYINLALNLASLATNPISLGRLVLVSIATRRAMGALVRGVTGLPLGHFFPSSSPHAFAWEKAPTSSKSYTDLALNPPPSQILLPLLDSFSEGSFDGDYGPDDSDVDSTEPLLYGGDVLDSFLAAEAWDLETPLQERNPKQALEEKLGIIYNAAAGYASAFNQAVGGG